MNDGERIKLMARALREWHCPSCGGTGAYMQRDSVHGARRIRCKVCSGLGLHPKASVALIDAGQELKE